MRRLALTVLALALAIVSQARLAVAQSTAPPGLRLIASSVDRKPVPSPPAPLPLPSGQAAIAAPRPFTVPVPDDGLSAAPRRIAPATAPASSPGILPVIYPGEARSAALSQAAASVPMTTPAADAGSSVVHLEKIGPTNVSLGKPLAYEIVVKNSGASPATQVRVEDDLPAGARLLDAYPRPDHSGSRLLWTVATLEPGQERRWRVRIQPTGEGEIQSTATVTYVAAAATSLRTQVTRPRLSVTQSGPESTLVGDPVTFRIQVKNSGNGSATGVIVRDRLPAGLKHEQGGLIEAELGTLGPGETKMLSVQALATQAGRQVNQVVVTAEGGLQVAAEAAIQVLEPALRLRKTGPQMRFLDREVEYDLEVSNPGTAPAMNVRVMDALPAGLDFVAASQGGQYDPAARQVNWQLGNLAATERRGLSLRALAKQRGDWTNRAVATADRGLEKRAEATLHVFGVPAVLLEVVDLNDPIEVGAETTYEIRVVNQGSSPITNLRILALVPDGLQAREAAGPTAYRIQGQQVIFEPLPQLATKADALFRVRARGVKPGDVRFKVGMSSDQLTTPVYEEESTRIYSDGE